MLLIILFAYNLSNYRIMWTKSPRPKSVMSTGAENSQPNGHLNTSSETSSNHASSRKMLFEDDQHKMNSLINLENECQTAMTNILNDPLSQNAVTIEQQMWTNFIKTYKVNLNGYMINYLIGYYTTLSDLLFFSTPRKDDYLKFNHFGFQMNQTNLVLMYNIHIRLGDLYRYADSRSNAKNYYNQALQIDPRRGTSYNQLALCTPLNKPYKLLYLSILASKSFIGPIKSANANFKKALSRVDNPIFQQLRSAIGLPLAEGSITVPEPDTGADWFYLSVISIYLNDFNHTLAALLDWILDLTQKKTDNTNLDYSLMALDIALDWIMKDRNNLLKKEAIEQTIRLIGSQFKNTVNLGDSENNSKLILSQKIALKHNFILKDFLPLKDLYETLYFYDELQRYNVKRDRKILTTRLIHKLRIF